MNKRNFMKKAVCSLCVATMFISSVYITGGYATALGSGFDGEIEIQPGWDGKITWERFREMFPDEYLFDVVKQHILGSDIKEGDSFPRERLNYIENLRIVVPDGETVNLAGIEKLENIKELQVEGNVESLAYLRLCRNLTYLSLTNTNNITSLEDLSGMSSLTSVYLLWCDELKSLTGLENNAGMEELDIKQCYNLEDISACKYLNCLKNVSFSSDKKLKDISSLAKLTLLESVDIYGTKVSDISPLKNKYNLKKLDIGYTNVASDRQNVCDVLETLDLTHLSAVSAGVNDEMMKTIVKLSNLERLDLLDNNIKDISDIVRLEKLWGLDIGGNSITDLRPLASLPNLKVYALMNESEKYQSVRVTGKDYIFKNPYIGMDGQPVVPEPSDIYTYNPEDNTIIINENQRGEKSYNIRAYADMNYNGRTFKMKLTTRYAVINDITITKQPESVTCTEGDKITLSVEAESKDSDFTYKWYKDGTLLSGNTKATLKITASELTDAGNYKCVVSNGAASAESEVATVVVTKKGEVNPITITKQPEPVTCTEGDKITLSVEAESKDSEFTYKWYKDDTVLENENTATLEIAKSELTDAGTYKCVVSNGTASAESDMAVVVVTEKEEISPVTITKQPKSVTCTEGDKITLSVEAESQDSELTYKWYKDDTALENENRETLEIAKSELTDAGTYKCVVSNGTASAESDMAVVVVTEKEEISPVTITKQPKSVTCKEGDKITLSVEAESQDSEFTYKWYKDDTALENENRATLEIAKSELTDAGTYKCVVSNGTASAESEAATVVVIKKEEPSSEEPSTEEPSSEKPSTEEPSSEKPSTEEPTTQKQIVNTPTTKETQSTERNTTKTEIKNTTDNNSKNSNPKTGDDSMVVVFGVLMLISAGVVVGRKKIKE